MTSSVQGSDAGSSLRAGNSCSLRAIAFLTGKNGMMRVCGFPPRRSAKKPRRERAGAFDAQTGVNNNGSPDANAAPTVSGPIVARSSRHNRRRRGRRQRRGDRPSPNRDASRRASHHRASRHSRRRRKSAPMRPHPAKPRQLQRAKVCVTWSSPQGSARSAPSVELLPVASSLDACLAFPGAPLKPSLSPRS